MAPDDDIQHIAHLLSDIDEITRQAHSAYRAYPPEVLLVHSSRTAAACTYDHMASLAYQRWLDRRGIVAKEIGGLKLWLIADKAVLRFKKMDEDGKSRNYPTRQAMEYDRGVPLPGLPDPATRLTAGYLLDPTQTQFVRAQVSKPRGEAMEWCVAIIPPSEPGRPATWQDVTRQGRFGP